MRAALPTAAERRWRMVPFRARLTLGFAVAMIVLFGGLALLLHTLVESSLDQQIDRTLQSRSVDLASIVHDQSAFASLPDSGGTFAQVISVRSGAVLDATPGHATALLTGAQLRAAPRDSRLIDTSHDARLLAVRIPADEPEVLVVGASLAQRNHTLTVLSELLFAGGPLLLLLTCLAGYVLAERALAPVERMSLEAAQISGAPAGERLPVPDANDEIRRLGETLNDLLDRVEVALTRERSFVSDASHELRTPLAVLKLELEFALSAEISREELQERVKSAAEEVDRLTKVAQDLLLIARADQGRLPIERTEVDVADVLGAIADRWEQPAAAVGTGRSVRFAHAGGDGAGGGVGVGAGGAGGDAGGGVADASHGRLAVSADRTWLEQALGNLVSNALRYGDGEVVLTARGTPAGVELHVLDAGSGFDPEFIRCAFERFARSDASRHGIGAGLGLSIVRAIAEAHGGRAGARNRPGGGADVWLSLPQVATGASTPAPLEVVG